MVLFLKSHFIRLLCSIELASILLIALTPIASINVAKKNYACFVPAYRNHILRGTPPETPGNGRLYSGDSRVSYVAEERFYKMITDKYAAVDKLIEEHKDPNDKLQLRLNYVQCTSNLKLSDMLKRNSGQTSHKPALIADMKRRTPTHNPTCDNNILSYTNAGEVALSMANVGRRPATLRLRRRVRQHRRRQLRRAHQRPPQNVPGAENAGAARKARHRDEGHRAAPDPAAENRADGVVLNAPILGNALNDMLTACISMGIEAIVEVHTAVEALRAIDMGASIIMINQWDRVKNVLHPTRALELKESLPEDVTLIAAGGIMTMQQVHELALAGFDAVVFGRRLVYPDVPDFIKQVRTWIGPPKPILKLSKHEFFEFKNEGGKPSVALRDNHMALLNEMNYFYFGRGHEVSVSDEIKAINVEPECKIDYEAVLTEDQKAREVTVNMGTPTSEEALVRVVGYAHTQNDLTKTVEGQEEDFDVNIQRHKKRADVFLAKWYVEKRKWLRENRRLYDSDQEAEAAYDLKKAVEMYNHFRYVAKPHLTEVLTADEIRESEEALLKNVLKLYERAPKEHGRVKLDFGGVDDGANEAANT